jgi:hypothetical protein
MFQDALIHSTATDSAVGEAKRSAAEAKAMVEAVITRRWDVEDKVEELERWRKRIDKLTVIRASGSIE